MVQGQVDPVVQRESLERDRALQDRGDLSLPAEVKTRGRLSLSEGRGWKKKGSGAHKMVIRSW